MAEVMAAEAVDDEVDYPLQVDYCGGKCEIYIALLFLSLEYLFLYSVWNASGGKINHHLSEIFLQWNRDSLFPCQYCEYSVDPSKCYAWMQVHLPVHYAKIVDQSKGIAA